MKMFMYFAILILGAMVENMATAKNITVGSPGGSWDQTTDLKKWASTQTFTKGDNLIFSYNPSTHDVLEVNKGGYDSCSTANPESTHTTGNDVFPLTSTGKRYFICGAAGHCQSGMKVEIDTVDASNPSPSTPADGPAGTTPSPPPPPPSRSSRVEGSHVKVVVGVLAVIMAFAL